MTTVVIVDEAEAQLTENHEWWVAHRDASMLVLDEFERCVSLLSSSPDIGTRFHRAFVPGVRRLLMKKTSHCVYYLHDERRSPACRSALTSQARRSRSRFRLRVGLSGAR
jgi:plasmid stabilization system protein ParE